MYCWGAVEGLRHRDGLWSRIECRLCAQKVEGKDAQLEAARMHLESESNMPQARSGRASRYDKSARFVLKLLPVMDSDVERVTERIAANTAAGPKPGRLGRGDFPPGTPGYLFAQASAFLSALNKLPREVAALSLDDMQFGIPEHVRVQAPMTGAPWKISTEIPATHHRPPDAELTGRMGTAMVAGMIGAFACEVALKALLLTRLDEAEKTHDLSRLYEALPEDCRERLEGDFPQIESELEKNRHAFGEWRYFEQSSGNAFAALIDTDRVGGLGKAARVLLDECTVAGLQYDIGVRGDYKISGDTPNLETLAHLHLTVVGHETAIAWEEILK